MPGKWDHDREEAYDGTLRVGDHGKGMWIYDGEGELRREGGEMEEGPGMQHGDLPRMETGGIYRGRSSCWRGLTQM